MFRFFPLIIAQHYILLEVYCQQIKLQTLLIFSLWLVKFLNLIFMKGYLIVFCYSLVILLYLLYCYLVFFFFNYTYYQVPTNMLYHLMLNILTRLQIMKFVLLYYFIPVCFNLCSRTRSKYFLYNFNLAFNLQNNYYINTLLC